MLAVARRDESKLEAFQFDERLTCAFKHVLTRKKISRLHVRLESASLSIKSLVDIIYDKGISTIRIEASLDDDLLRELERLKSVRHYLSMMT